jgi:hypothetical protein
MIFKDTIIYNALGFQYTGNLNNKRYINLSLTAYIKRRFKQITHDFWLCCVLGVSLLPLSMICLLKFRNVPKVWYFIFSIKIRVTKMFCCTELMRSCKCFLHVSKMPTLTYNPEKSVIHEFCHCCVAVVLTQWCEVFSQKIA